MNFNKNFSLYLIISIIFSLLVLGVGLIWLEDFSFFKSFNRDNFLAINSSSKTTDLIKSYQVKKVVDGDTIETDTGLTIRYLNIDTPETKKPATPVQCYGPESFQENIRLVKDKKIWVTSDKQDEDRYGRKLRFIFLSENETSQIEKSVNARLVADGFGKVMVIKPNNTFENQFRKLEYQAKEKKLGLWGTC